MLRNAQRVDPKCRTQISEKMFNQKRFGTWVSSPRQQNNSKMGQAEAESEKTGKEETRKAKMNWHRR